MDCLTILAQAADSARTNANAGGEPILSIDALWKQISSLQQLEAFMFVAFGVVWLFYGWRVFKILVVLTFALMGWALGWRLTDIVQGIDNQLLGAAIGMAVLAALSVPLMRWAVSILGAFAGAVFTGGIWYAIGLKPEYIWAGALIGMVAGGMISFIVFRIAVILFTSMGGGALIMMGGLALLYKYFPERFHYGYVTTNGKWILPLAIMVPMLLGLIAQHKFVKGSKEWEI